ncbi:MAG: hypothetical protein FWF02_00150 [Micrococcales bacterium]|nr:hypothetical protein [Micrococcales bacterium]MCL2666110.1 hypothetical protein [Micrococcales bacterium]
MSSVACFYRVDRVELEASPVSEVIGEGTDLGLGYPWSGHVMMALLDYLDEIEIGVGLDLDIADDDDAPLVAFFTRADAPAILGLQVAQILGDETMFDDLGLDDEEIVDAVRDSVETLRELIDGTGPDEVLVVAVY